VARRPSLISDDLLRQLMAAGQADLLVGVPTLNNAATIEPVLAAVHQAIADGLTHHRVLIVNSDGGSEDGTQARLRSASESRGATLLASHSLRTLHRIVVPYHGLPGKRAAIQILFAAADLLQTRAVAIIDPAASSPSAEALLALFQLGLTGDNDFVAAAPLRDPREGPLVTQVVRPLIAAAFGTSFEDPLGEEFVASGAFVADALAQPVWDDEPLRAGVDLWLRVHALAGPFRSVQVQTPPRTRQSPPAPPSLLGVLRQVLSATWVCLDRYAPRWTSDRLVDPPRLLARDTAAPAGPTWDWPAMARAYRDAIHDLDPIWSRLLSPAVLRELRSASAADPVCVPDALWADILLDYAISWRHGRGRADDLAASFFPLYLGRAASYLRETEGLDAEASRARLDALARHVRERRSRLVDAWRPAGPGGS
jgi:hypothetical protein